MKVFSSTSTGFILGRNKSNCNLRKWIVCWWWLKVNIDQCNSRCFPLGLVKLDAFSAVHFDRNLTQLVGLLESAGFETRFIVMGFNLRIKYTVKSWKIYFFQFWVSWVINGWWPCQLDMEEVRQSWEGMFWLKIAT